MPRPKPYQRPPKQGQQRQKRDWFDKVTAISAIVGIVVAVATLVFSQLDQISSGRDTARAVSGLEGIANSMAEQANAMQGEGPDIARQADAAADSAQAAKDTAAAARGQTEAVTDQAQALIKSANASLKATQVQLAAAQAQLEAATAVRDTAAPVARFAGIAMSDVTSKPNKDGIILFKIRPYFVNIGSVALIPSVTYAHLLFARTLPAHPVIKNELAFGGNDISVPVGQGYGPSDVEMTMTPAERDDLISGKLSIFIWGYTQYSGPHGGKIERRCFAAQSKLKDGGFDQAAMRLIDRPEYQC